MGDVVHATFGSTLGYEEALFRQALNQEMNENGGILTHGTVERAYLRTVEIAVIYKEEDPKQLDMFVEITLSLLERERDLAGQDWSP